MYYTLCINTRYVSYVICQYKICIIRYISMQDKYDALSINKRYISFVMYPYKICIIFYISI